MDSQTVNKKNTPEKHPSGDIAIFNLVRYKYANRPNPLTPFPKRGGGKIQSLSPQRREVKRYKRLKILDATMKRHQYQKDALIEVLDKAQELFGYLENDLLHYIAQSLKLPPSRVYGVAIFITSSFLHQKAHIVRAHELLESSAVSGQLLLICSSGNN